MDIILVKVCGLTQDAFKDIQISSRKLWENYFSFPGCIHQFIPNLNDYLN